MSDAFVTLVSIQPSVSTQQESGAEADALGSGSTKQGMYGRRRRDVIRQAGQEGGYVPILPRSLHAVPGVAKNTLSWLPTAGASSYNLYWATTPGVSKSSNKLTGVTTPVEHTDLVPGQTYYYALGLVRGQDEELGQEVSATALAPPIVHPLLAPVIYECASTGTAPPTINIKWTRYDLRSGTFNLYWSTTPGVTKNSNKVANLSAYAYALTGVPINFSSTYYVAVSVVLDGQESELSNEVSATTPAYSFRVSSFVSATDATNTLTFGTYKADTTSFNIYWSETPGVTKSSNKITGASSPYAHLYLENEKAYYYALAAVGSDGESVLTEEVGVTTPKANPFPAGAVLWYDTTNSQCWPGSGTQLKDLSGNGYHLTIDPSYMVTQGGLPVLRMPGTLCYSVPGLNLSQPCTVLSIARFNGQGSNLKARVISSSTTNWLSGFWGGFSGVAYLAGWVTQNTNGTVPNADTLWHCEISTMKSGEYHHYHDGLEATYYPTGGTAGPGTISIGGWGQGPAEFSNCDVAVLVAWNRVLTPDEVQNAYDAIAAKFAIRTSTDALLPGGTKLLYNFETSASLVDSAFLLDLTKSGSPVLDVSGRLGGKCWDFNNAGWAYQSIGATSLSQTAVRNTFKYDFTIEGWLYYPSDRSGTFPEWFFYAGSGNSTSGRGMTAFVDWSNAYGGNRKIVWLWWAGADSQFAGADTQADTWTHFALRRKYDTAAGNWLTEAWQNGIQVNSSRGGAITATLSQLFIGSDYGATAFAGKLDTVRISNKYRTDDELRWFFNNT